MRRLRIYLGVLLGLMFLQGCDRENDINTLPPSNLRTIVSFNLYRFNNPLNLFSSVYGTIDEANKIITLRFTPGSYPNLDSLRSLRPQIYIAPWATVSPDNLQPVDLRPDTVEFTVTAQSGKKAVYAVVKKFN